MHLLGDSLRYSRLAPDDKTLEFLLLRQQLLMVRRHQKRGATITRTEKLLLLTLVEQLRSIVELPKAQLEQLILVFNPIRCSGGTVSWSNASGLSNAHRSVSGDHPSNRRLFSWCSDSPVRIGGVMTGSPEN